jgi:hypothetical protein
LKKRQEGIEFEMECFEKLKFVNGVRRENIRMVWPCGINRSKRDIQKDSRIKIASKKIYETSQKKMI